MLASGLVASYFMWVALYVCHRRFLSPIGACIVCLIIFLTIRTLVLRRENSTNWSFYVLPVMLVVTVWVNLFFIITKVSVDEWYPNSGTESTVGLSRWLVLGVGC